MDAKKWADRLPLDDIRGIRLLAAAIYYAECRCVRDAMKVHKSGYWRQEAVVPGEETRSAEIEALGVIARAEVAVRYWRAKLDKLGATEAEVAAGEHALIGDFIFDPADLWRHKHLAVFVVDDQCSSWTKFDRETPICENTDLWPRADLLALFEQYLSWHDAPLHARPIFNNEFGHQIEHHHWQNYLAPYCEEPQGQHRPSGSGYNDGAPNAASEAWGLLYCANSSGTPLSVSDAVRQSLLSFDVEVTTSEDPRLALPPRLRDKNVIFASSKEQAEKRVRKLLEAMMAKEPPCAPVEPLSVLN